MSGRDEADERRRLGDFVGGEGFEAVSGAGVLDGVVEDGSKVGWIGHKRLVLEQLEWACQCDQRSVPV